jgi:anion-transporting  ArsA/GET3 family ATPase
LSSNAGLTVVVGGGGVGKTTTSAALGVALGRAGRRTLVVTVDPARRLADALGVQVGTQSCRVEIDGVELWARMPDARHSVDVFADWLFQDPAARERVKQNSMYRELSNALAGVHELISVAFVDHELESGLYDEIVLDTAPSRHALEFLDYPARLARMLEAKTLAWVAGLARLAGATLEGRPDDRGLIAWGKKRVGQMVSNLVGVHAIRDVAALFSEFVLVRERWLSLVERVEWRIAAPTTRYMIVSGPSGSSLDDAEYLGNELGRRRLRPSAWILNRAQEEAPEWLATVVARRDREAVLGPAIDAYAVEFEARRAQTRAARARLEGLNRGGASLAMLPALRTADPREILIVLAKALETLEL